MFYLKITALEKLFGKANFGYTLHNHLFTGYNDMNQTQKRLSIINLAISITDLETIQYQIAKLRLLENDEKIREIILALEAKNYAYSQTLINNYINTPIQTVHQRIAEPKRERHTEKEKELIKQFDLHVLSSHSEENYDLAEMNAPYSKKSSFDAFLSLSADDVLADNIAIKKNGDDFFEDKKGQPPVNLLHEDIPKDDFFDTVLPDKHLEETSLSSTQESTPITEEETSVPIIDPDDLTEAEQPAEQSQTEIYEDEKYRPILSIKEQFEALSQKYPPLYKSSQPFPSIEKWLEQIKTEGYTDNEVEEAVREAMHLTANENDEAHCEAAELMLLLGCSENKFSKLILARELYKGKLFEQNIEEAFSMILQLANDTYPEALCDLAQFYEHGIGTEANAKEAKKLYKQAMELGLGRAETHFKRLKKGFFF